tara:strand:- start:3592 stop:4530 length:939 start_codon:yes stop_codon:yes gene_type:complete
MAIYTKISEKEVQKLFIKIGKVISAEGIQEGVENTNYKIILENNKEYILTIFEKRTKEEDLPFFNQSMLEFKNNGIPCPTAVNIGGSTIFKTHDKNCSIYDFLEGRPINQINNDALYSLSEVIAELHKAGRASKLKRENTMLIPTWNYILNKFNNFQNHKFAHEIQLVSKSIYEIQDQFPKDLEMALIHADLFPDNIFFKDNKVSGIIDFFFTCQDTVIYDLSTLINSWFFNSDFDESNCIIFLNNYLDNTNLKQNEKEYFNFYLKVSAIRFFLTRLHDMYFNNSGDVIHKDPMAFFNILRFHQKNNLKELI